MRKETYRNIESPPPLIRKGKIYEKKNPSLSLVILLCIIHHSTSDADAGPHSSLLAVAVPFESLLLLPSGGCGA